EYVPWLAERYAWSGGYRRLRFELRRGVSWSDGEPFDASDVAFTFRLLREHPGLDLYGVWRFLRDVRADGPYAVEIELARPYVPGLYYLGQQPIVPEHVWAHVDDPLTFANPEPVATGPFVRVSSFQAQAYQIERNERYWQPGKPRARALR